jgi:hypothetical protein
MEMNIFLSVNAKLGWLNNVSGLHLVVFSLLQTGQQVLKRFPQAPAVSSHWLEYFADSTPTARKTY